VGGLGKTDRRITKSKEKRANGIKGGPVPHILHGAREKRAEEEEGRLCDPEKKINFEKLPLRSNSFVLWLGGKAGGHGEKVRISLPRSEYRGKGGRRIYLRAK